MHTPSSPIDDSWLSRFVEAYDIAIDKQSVADEATNMVSGTAVCVKLLLALQVHFKWAAQTQGYQWGADSGGGVIPI